MLGAPVLPCIAASSFGVQPRRHHRRLPLWYCIISRIRVAYAVCLLRRNLSRLEGLPDLITQHVGVPALLPARDGFVSGLGKQKLRISGLRVALIGRDQFPVSGFLRALSIVETVFQRLRYGFAPADMVGFEKCGRRKITSSTAKERRLPKQPPQLWDTLSRSCQFAIKPLRDSFSPSSFPMSQSASAGRP